VRSKQGAKGGYRLVEDPSKITLAEIHRLFDGAIALVPCVSQKFYEPCDDCPDPENCRLKRVFLDVRDQTYDLLAEVTVASFISSPKRSQKRAKKTT
jgi:Rrf2 family protein